MTLSILQFNSVTTIGMTVIEGEVVRQQKKSMYVECTFYLEDEVVAKATATQVVYGSKPEPLPIRNAARFSPIDHFSRSVWHAVWFVGVMDSSVGDTSGGKSADLRIEPSGSRSNKKLRGHLPRRDLGRHP